MNLPEGLYIFVFATDPTTEKDTFYAAHKEKTFKGLMQHSSFFQGNNICAAGKIHVNAEHCITKITNSSGHYQCDEADMESVVTYLSDVGCDLQFVEMRLYEWGFHEHVHAYNCADWFRSRAVCQN